MITWPIFTRATVPWGLPNAPRIPVCSLWEKKLYRNRMWAFAFLVSSLSLTSQTLSVPQRWALSYQHTEEEGFGDLGLLYVRQKGFGLWQPPCNPDEPHMQGIQCKQSEARISPTLNTPSTVTSAPSLPISPGTWQHLVDSEHMEGMKAYPQMELILPTVLHHVLVGTDAGSFQCLAGELFVLIWDQVDTERKVVYGRLLGTKVIDPDFGIWKTYRNRHFQSFAFWTSSGKSPPTYWPDETQW